MGKRGPKPRGKVKIKWSAEFAYAIGLLVTDGNLSKDGRHIDLTSKDREQLENFSSCLGAKFRITTKSSGFNNRKYLRIQFSDVNFYNFLLALGLMPAKTKKLKAVDIPDKYFFDFLRGHLDGDGSFYSFWDKRWKSSFMFYTVFVSASEPHIKWLRSRIHKALEIRGHLDKSPRRSAYQLKYAKKESLELLKKIYYSKSVVCLSRKRLKIESALSIMGKKL